MKHTHYWFRIYNAEYRLWQYRCHICKEIGYGVPA